MIRINNLRLSPNYKEDELIKKIVKELNCKKDEIVSYELFKLSIDARKKSDVHFLATVDVKVKNENSTLKRTKRFLKVKSTNMNNLFAKITVATQLLLVQVLPDYLQV